ncbi:MAG TPA: hypothetical protein PK843_18235 [bacterium]|nr:hypothetical protein [bacterium]
MKNSISGPTFALLILLASGFAGQAEDFSVPAATSVPFTYCIWYLSNPDQGSFYQDLAASPPDLFHLGYHLPFKGALGPTYGHDLFTNEILPPEQIPREVHRVQNIISRMRSAGVARLVPYVYTMAFFGQPDFRSGFFKFFDHWADYADFGLGAKPEVDPSLWTQERGPQQLGGGPPGILHYEPCINQPPWTRYLDVVVRQAAATGYDGMFFDVNTLYCFCPHCQEKFDVYLLDKYGRKGLRERFGTEDHRLINLSTIYRDFEKVVLSHFTPYLETIWQSENLSRLTGFQNAGEAKLEEDWRLLRCYMQGSQGEFPPAEELSSHLLTRFGVQQPDALEPDRRRAFVQTVLRRAFLNYLSSSELAILLNEQFGSADIRRRCCSDPKELLRWVETQRFWCDCIAQRFNGLRTVGQTELIRTQRNQAFFTIANLGSMGTLDAMNKRRVDGIHAVRWAPSVSMQMFEEMQQPGMLESGVILSNVFAFRWAMAAGTRAGALLYKSTSERAADLSEAEAAAGGGGAFIQIGLEAPHSRARWKQFFHQHADFWDQGSSWCQVGLLFFNEQAFYEYPEHYAIVQRLAKVFSESQIPFDLVVEPGLNTIGFYPVIVAPMLRYLDDSQINALLAYARKGGRLVIVEPFGSEDAYALPRSQVLPNGPWGQAIAYGDGQLLRLKENEIPKRLSDMWCLMEERGNAFRLCRDYLNTARTLDRANGTDLGPRFVARLEKALNLRLRWCESKTDPGVYVHAYRIPAKDARPQRLILHAVNYHIPILVDPEKDAQGDEVWASVTRSGEPVVVKNLAVAVPLPSGLQATRVHAYSPVESTRPIAWRQADDRVEIALKRLELYQAVCIDLL